MHFITKYYIENRYCNTNAIPLANSVVDASESEVCCASYELRNVHVFLNMLSFFVYECIQQINN